MNRILKRVAQKANNSKGVLVAGATAVGATASQAAVTVDGATGLLTGSIDTDLYASGIPIAIGFLTFTLAAVAVFSLLKKSH